MRNQFLRTKDYTHAGLTIGIVVVWSFSPQRIINTFNVLCYPILVPSTKIRILFTMWGSPETMRDSFNTMRDSSRTPLILTAYVTQTYNPQGPLSVIPRWFKGSLEGPSRNPRVPLEGPSTDPYGGIGGGVSTPWLSWFDITRFGQSLNCGMYITHYST